MKIKNNQGQVRNGIKIFGFIFLVNNVLVIASLLPSPDSVTLWIQAGAVLIISWLCLRWEKNVLSSIGLCINSNFVSEFLIGTIFGILLILVSALTIKSFGGFDWVRNSQVSLGQLFYSSVPFIAISVTEELIFRGYAFQRAIRGFGRILALTLFGGLFILMHWNNPGMTGSTKFLASLGIGLASVLLGLAYIRTGSLALPIGIHLGWNWAQGSLLGFGVSGTKSRGYWEPIFNDFPSWFTGGEFGLEASLPGVLICLIACFSIGFWRPDRNHEKMS
ncbi:MAG: CPBP family intramembrane metalloprotease [Holophagaceae bacterium]|nr:CPBP family intramembrane metalloprotease [Holophagaceae bacterium]